MWLTPNQKKVLRVFIQHRRVPLTNREVGLMCGKPPEKAKAWGRNIVEKLLYKGLLVRREIDGKDGLLASEKALNSQLAATLLMNARPVAAQGGPDEEKSILDYLDKMDSNRKLVPTEKDLYHPRFQRRQSLW